MAERVMSAAGLVFKGSGFYITDYGKDGKGPRKAESDKPAAETKAEPAKADAKPAPKSETKAEAKPAKKAASE